MRSCIIGVFLGSVGENNTEKGFPKITGEAFCNNINIEKHHTIHHNSQEFSAERQKNQDLSPPSRKPALTDDFTYEHFCQEAAEELLKVKDLEKRLEYNNLMAE